MDTFKSEPGKLQWRKATRSIGNGACVEVSADTGNVLVRDSTNLDGPIMRYPGEAWQSFLGKMKGSAAVK